MSDRRSRAIAEGDRRAPNRSMQHAAGFDDASGVMRQAFRAVSVAHEPARGVATDGA